MSILTAIAFFCYILVVWFVAIVILPGAAHQAEGKSGGVSITPGIPLFPFVAWLIALILNAFSDGVGYYIMGTLHALLFVVAVGWIIKYSRDAKRRAKTDPTVSSPKN